MFSKTSTRTSTGLSWESLARLRQALDRADAVVIGAGSGLSTSAGFTYSGPRFQAHFGDFIEKYHIPDLYSGGFYPFPSLEEYWAWWSRHIYWNRYVDAPKPGYDDLQELAVNIGGEHQIVFLSHQNQNVVIHGHGRSQPAGPVEEAGPPGQRLLQRGDGVDAY